MSQSEGGPDRDMSEIAQSVEFMSEDFAELADKLQNRTRHEYLGDQLRTMHAIQTKLKYNIKKLERMTGQSPYTQERFPF